MSTHETGPAGDGAHEAARYAELAERSRRIGAAILERRMREVSGQEFSLIDYAGVTRAFQQFGAQLLADPRRLVQAQTAFWRDYAALWHNTLQAFETGTLDPVVPVDGTDRRFKDKAWQADPIFGHLQQNFLLAERWLRDLVDHAEGLDPQTRRKVAFYTRQWLAALSPSNHPLTNPTVLERIKATKGDNLWQGLQHLLDDLERGEGRLQIRMTDETAFEVGRNLAVSPGRVVFQNELMQLIQYAPATETVYKRPLLIVPPWINKYYILDLQPKNSFVKYLVEQGHTVFLISWVNPSEELAHKTFEDYMHEGPLAAIDAIEQATGEREVNLLGFCIGGILTVVTLAWLAARREKRVASATLLASMVDLADIGEAAVFIDDDQLAAMEKHMAEKGYLEGHHMADMFSMMRENDLIWSFVVNNYLMGREPMAFDLLYWNADATRLPAAMLLYYLRHLYMDNAVTRPGGLVLDGTPIDTRKIRLPIYSVATREDHIAPWRSCFPVTAMTRGKVRFVLGGSGHIAGIVNPPDRGKYGFWTSDEAAADPDSWLEGATHHEGSWWPDWAAWIAPHGGRKLPARVPGEGGLPALEDAPGAYVRAKAPE